MEFKNQWFKIQRNKINTARVQGLTQGISCSYQPMIFDIINDKKKLSDKKKKKLYDTDGSVTTKNIQSRSTLLNNS